MSVRYDIDLFRALNAEYADKRLVPAPRQTTQRSLHEQAVKRAKWVDRRLKLRGKRVLEIGAGRGHFCDVLAADYGCEVVGVDIAEYDTWSEFDPRRDLRVFDITTEDLTPLGTFDRIVSFAVFEHVERPYEGLRAMYDLLRPDGVAYMSANLYRGPTASHRYRQVYFPFPHLLFDDEVFAEFYEATGFPHRSAAWVNKLTAAQYRERVRDLGFDITEQWTDVKPLDHGFYERFSDVLGRYPIDDLETDFLHLVLTKRAAPTRVDRWVPPGARDLAADGRRFASRVKRRLSRLAG
jgi:SAM-dependent methyltransferase